MAEQNLLLAGKAQFATPTPVNGDVIPLSMNSAGQVRVASSAAKLAGASAALVVVNDALIVNVDDASNIMVHVKNTGTASMAAGTFLFEGSIDSTNGIDGTWFGIVAARSNSATTVESTTGTISLSSGLAMGYSWEMSVNGIKWFRVRCSVAVTANSIAFWTATLGTQATEPVTVITAHGVTSTPASGTNYALTTAASTNAATVKSSSGNLYEVSVFNSTAATIYVRFYNKSSSPTVGTDIPIVVIPVTTNALVVSEFGNLGKRFSNGIAISVTAAAPNTDATVVAAGALISATYF